MMRPAWQLDAQSPATTLCDVHLPAVAVNSPLPNRRHPAAVGTDRVVLPWDFKRTFPRPLEAAIDAGKIDPSDAEPENLATIHDEHAREALALLSEIDALSDAKVHGVDPKTGKKPRTEKQRIALERLYAEEPTRLQHAFDVLMDVYAEVFGDEAGLAFRQAVTCWHAGVTVVAPVSTPKGTVQLPPELLGEAGLPVSRPLWTAIQSAAFGAELETGEPVEPSDEEIIAITESAAAKLAAAVDPDGNVSQSYQALMQAYRNDFGDAAARTLNAFVRRRVARESGTYEPQYDPGHPWYYYDAGDGMPPLDVDEIEPAKRSLDLGVTLPKSPAKRHQLLKQMYDDAVRQLDEDKERYSELVDHGVAALSEYDRTIAYGGNDALAIASALALKHNHIANALARVEQLEDLLEQIEADSLYR
jgi:hypothetical protein